MFTARPFVSPEAQRLLELLKTLFGSTFRQILWRNAAELELTYAQAQVLFYVAQHAGCHMGQVAKTFNVTLSAVSSQTVTVDYATADGTALVGNDYQPASGTLTFAPGETSKPITVTVSGDTTNEPDETFFVNLANPANSTISKAQGLGTIINDDNVAAPTLQFSSANYNVQEALGALTITVTRSGDTSGPASVNGIAPRISILGNRIQLIWEARTRASYEVLYKDNLSDAEWKPVEGEVIAPWKIVDGTVQPDTYTATAEDLLAPQMRFYRVLEY